MLRYSITEINGLASSCGQTADRIMDAGRAVRYSVEDLALPEMVAAVERFELEMRRRHEELAHSLHSVAALARKSAQAFAAEDHRHAAGTGPKGGHRRGGAGGGASTISPVLIEAQARRLEAGRKRIEAQLNRMARQIDHLISAGFVTDVASRKLKHSFNEFKIGQYEIINALTEMSMHLERVSHGFQAVDRDLAASMQS